jgi:hypothetical protein
MAAKKYTVDDLISSVKARASVPETDGNLTDNDILRFANEEMDENIVPLILSTREELYLTYEDVAVVDGALEYDIPYRAVGTKVRIIKPIVDGKEGRALSHIPVDLVDNYDAIYDYDIDRGFYLRNDKIILVNPLNTTGTGTLRVYYYFRPNNLVSLDSVGTITEIDTNTNTVTVSDFPSSFSGSPEVDFIQSTPNHRTISFDAQVSSVSSITREIVLSDDLPSTLKVGDYICLAGESPTPQMPVDIIPVLEQSVVCKILEAQGDTEGLKNAYSRLQKLEQRLFNVIDDRIEAPGRKVINQNSLLSRRRRSRYGLF